MKKQYKILFTNKLSRESSEKIVDDVVHEIMKLYREDKDCLVLEEFIEEGRLRIKGLPLYMQVAIYCRLKKEIDGDDIVIKNEYGEIEEEPLYDYLI